MLPTDPVELVKHFEGCSLSSYQDEAGVWTVGYGCTGPNITAHTVWTQERAEAEVRARVARVQHVLEAMLLDAKVAPTPGQLAAMVSLAYNVGLGDPKTGGGFEGSTLRAKFLAGDVLGAALEFPRWCHAGGKVSKGLLKRRAQELLLFLE